MRQEEEVAELARSMFLAGQTLEPPRFHHTGWVPGQRFSATDDPDRVQQAWTAPGFLWAEDPAERSKNVVVEDVDIKRVSGATSSSFAKIVRNVLDEKECATLIGSVNTKGYTPALINGGGGWQVLAPEARDGHRVIVECSALSDWLMEVLRPHLPELHEGAKLVELNERSRFLCYTPGQYFAPHHDGMFTRPRGHPKAGDHSLVTIQIYFHDVPPANGGATSFLDDDDGPVAVCQPAVGSALIFTQDLYHEGSLVNDGIKYTLRTEAMYRLSSRRREPADLLQ